MPTSDRERPAARPHRQQARPAAGRTRSRSTVQVVAAVLAVLAVVAGTLVAARLAGRDDTVSTAPAAAPSPSATGAATTGAASCVYTPTAGEPAAKPVSPPPGGAPSTAPYAATLKTSAGTVAFEALAAQAPCTAASFRHLATSKFFDGTSCHRLTTEGIFVLQCGDPTGSGSGGPGYGFGIENAPATGVYPAGTVAMARSQDPGSNGSQFFLVYQDTRLPVEGGGYTVFGRVTAGLDVLREVAEAGTAGGGDGKPTVPVDIQTVTISQPKA